MVINKKNLFRGGSSQYSRNVKWKPRRVLKRAKRTRGGTKYENVEGCEQSSDFIPDHFYSIIRLCMYWQSCPQIVLIDETFCGCGGDWVGCLSKFNTGAVLRNKLGPNLLRNVVYCNYQ